MPAPIADTRVLQGTAATIPVVLRDQNGEPVAGAGTVTVDAVSASGAVVATGRAATPSTGVTGGYEASFTAAELATLDLWTLTWKDNGVARLSTLVDIVGGYYFDVAAIREREGELADTSRYPTEMLLKYRRIVEEEAERVAGCAFVPRYRRMEFRTAGTGEIHLPYTMLRRVREISPDYMAAFSSDDISRLTYRAERGTILLGYGAVPVGNVMIGWEHGYDRPPEAVLTMAIRRLRYHLNLAKSANPDRSARLVIDGETGRTVQYATAGMCRTGDDDVDAVYKGAGKRNILVA